MDDDFTFSPIGYMKTCFMTKNGTPRQPSISSVSKGSVKILKSFFNNPEHSIDGLAQFSHVWILFVFHLNESKAVKAKVKPPRMNGLKTGVFSTRSPHRPNPIGLTLAKLESVERDTIYLSGVDIVNNTPVLDLKPYIPQYDYTHPDIPNETESSKVMPSREIDIQGPLFLNSECETSPICMPMIDTSGTNAILLNDKGRSRTGKETEHSEPFQQNSIIKSQEGNHSPAEVATWLKNPIVPELEVVFSNRALTNISRFKSTSSDELKVEKDSDWILEHLKVQDLQRAIFDVLKADPRSSYRRKKCSDRLYFFVIDNAHVTAWFDETVLPHCVEVIRVVPKQFVV